MASGKKTTTLTTTTTRRTPNSATKSGSFQESRLTVGKVKGGRGTGISVIYEKDPDMRSKLSAAASGKRKTWNSSTISDSVSDNAAVIPTATEKFQVQVQKQLQEKCVTHPTDSNCDCDGKKLNQDSCSSEINIRSNHSSNYEPLQKSKSEPLKVSLSNESELRKVNSEKVNSEKVKWDPSSCIRPRLTLSDSNQHDQIDGQQEASELPVVDASNSNKIQDLVVDSNEEKEPSSDEIEHSEKGKIEQDGTAFASTVVNSCGAYEEVQVSVEEKVIDTSSDHVDHALEVEAEGKQKLLVDNDDKDTEARGVDDQIQLDISKKNSLRNKTKKVKSPVPKFDVSLTKPTPGRHPSAATSTTASSKPLPSGSIHKPTLSSPTPPTTTAREASNEYEFYTSETHNKLQNLVDLVMWRDVSKSAFSFGLGTFIIISSSYATNIEFSLISVCSYLSLVYLALMFVYKAIKSRGIADTEDGPEKYVWGEEEAIWFVKLALPYLNEFLLMLRSIFSGDPAITLKLAVVLFVLARCGSCITIWKMLKLGFFGVFIIPKLCSCYSTQITAYAMFWVGRFRDAWESCSHKKALAFTIFTIVWNFSSLVARAWAAFMLFVAFRYYQQSLVTDDFVEVREQAGSHNVQIRRPLARHRCSLPTSLDHKKQKKSF